MREGGRNTRPRVILGLTGLAIAQVVTLLLLSRDVPPANPAAWGRLDFGTVSTVDARGRVEDLATGSPRLVLVFHTQCGHCRAVAPTWAEWLRTRPGELDVVAVTTESFDAAAVYARAHGWDVEVGSVVVPTVGVAARSLTARTPWVYGLDGSGRVVAAGHGSDVAAVAEQLRALR